MELQVLSSAGEALGRTRAVVDEGMRAGLHVGAQVYVSRWGEVVGELAAGEGRPGAAMTTGTPMPWLSAGKVVTSVGVAKLWEAGRIELDERVAAYVPEFSNGGKEGITVRHLLTHMAGIRGVGGAWARNSWDEIIAGICAAKVEPGWVVGRSAGYHAASTWYVLGEVIRRVTGRECGTWLREEVLVPLGMGDSWVGMPKEVWEGYGERVGVMMRTDVTPASPQTWEGWELFSFGRPGNNARGPVRELGKLYENLVLTGRTGHGSPSGARRLNSLLSVQTVEAITTPKRVGIIDQTFKAKIDWGLGFICNSRHYGQAGVPYQFGPYASDRTFGHAGNQSSVGMADPEHGVVIAAVFNGMPGEAKHDRRMRETLSAVYQDLGIGADGS